MEPQSCSASAFPYFEADAELGVSYMRVHHEGSPWGDRDGKTAVGFGLIPSSKKRK